MAPTALREALATAQSVPGVRECFILSTCNRTEVLVAGNPNESVEEGLTQRFLSAAGQGERYVFRGMHALAHVFRVASGLDSQVLGESQILAQLKEALVAAEDTGCIGASLRPLVTQALSVGKRVRTETSVGQGTLSVAKVGVEVAAHVFADFRELRALIVGAGETGLLVAQHLRTHDVGELVFANRTPERAAEAARELGGLSCSLEEAISMAGRSDLVVTCVDGGQRLIEAPALRSTGAAHRDRPLLLIDLSVPRAIDPRVAELEPVLYYDLDDLSKVVERNRVRRARGDEESSTILVAEIHKYLARRELARTAPAVAELRERFAEIRDEVVTAAGGERSALADELTKRLLDAAFGAFKQSARQRRSTDELDREYQRYLENL